MWIIFLISWTARSEKCGGVELIMCLILCLFNNLINSVETHAPSPSCRIWEGTPITFNTYANALIDAGGCLSLIGTQWMNWEDIGRQEHSTEPVIICCTVRPIADVYVQLMQRLWSNIAVELSVRFNLPWLVFIHPCFNTGHCYCIQHLVSLTISGEYTIESVVYIIIQLYVTRAPCQIALPLVLYIIYNMEII